MSTDKILDATYDPDADSAPWNQWWRTAVREIADRLELDAKRFGRRPHRDLSPDILSVVDHLVSQLVLDSKLWRARAAEYQSDNQTLQHQNDELRGKHAQWVCFNPGCNLHGKVMSMPTAPAGDRETVTRLCESCVGVMEPTSGHKRTLHEEALTSLDKAHAALTDAFRELGNVGASVRRYGTRP